MSKKLGKAAIAATLLGLTTIVATSGQVQAEKRTFYNCGRGDERWCNGR